MTKLDLKNLRVEDIGSVQVQCLIEYALSLENAIKEHRDARGDERCWLDDKVLYMALHDEQPVTALPPREEFLESCSRFHAQRQNPSSLPLHPFGMTITQLSFEVTNLRASLAMKDADLADLRKQLEQSRAYARSLQKMTENPIHED